MCYNYYIGTDQDLKEIRFNESKPDFWLERIDKIKLLPVQFQKKNVYEIGTSEGCGCSFGYERIPKEIYNRAKKCLLNGQDLSDELRRYFISEDTIEEIEETFKESEVFAQEAERFLNIIEDLLDRENTIEFYGGFLLDEKKKTIEYLEVEFDRTNFNFGIELFIEQPIIVLLKSKTTHNKGYNLWPIDWFRCRRKYSGHRS
jgi:hypothetical protein